MKNLVIKNFKSIKHLQLDYKKVNIFIGKPNTGKSNILESIGIFSFPHSIPYQANLRSFMRFEDMTNLFYDNDLDQNIAITVNNSVCEIKYENGRFIGSGSDKEKRFFNFDYDFQGSGSTGYVI